MTDPSKYGPLTPREMVGETQPITSRGGQVRELLASEISDVVEGELAPGTVLGDWRIERRIGQGGMGTVYAAVHGVIGKRAAIKVVRAELCRTPLTAERFVQEARVVNQIGHPNIVDIFHIGRLDDGRPYLVMELLRGRTLGERMFEGRISPREAIGVLLQITAAVTAAHDQGVVHRDLKPDNIFLADGNAGLTIVKIVDWGIAKLTDALPVAAVGLTTSGVMLGTPQYVSPEQARGRKLDARTDIYSLGAIAYEMFLEAPPFVADNVADVVSMHLRETPPAPSEVWPDVPLSLERLLLAMLAKDPDQRPSLTEVALTLELVRDDLETRTWPHARRRLAAGSTPPAMPVAPIDESIAQPRDRATRWPWMVAAMLVTGAVVAAIVVIAGRDHASVLRHEIELRPRLTVTAAPAPAPAPAPVAETPAPIAAPTLDVRVTPASARVRVDGVAESLVRGRLVRPVAAGAHVVRVEAAGFAPYDRTIEVSGTVVLDVVLARATRHGADKAAPAPALAPAPAPAPAIDPNATIEPFP
jgi:serine/threonine-protein kinase